MVQIRDTETGAIFRSSISAIKSKGFIFDRGFGNQVGLRLEDWVEVERKTEKIQRNYIGLLVGSKRKELQAIPPENLE